MIDLSGKEPERPKLFKGNANYGVMDSTLYNTASFLSEDVQPAPTFNESKPIVDSVIEELLKRKQLGIERYKVPLQAGNGRDALRDAFEEAMDLTLYLYQAIIERDNKE